ncbi:MAG: aminofutalosine synthase MqnE, partial [Desulfobulbaceae bacterium]|nr:aminofutalosine synthase MqnE [Desulfobulbaceae bacterium]
MDNLIIQAGLGNILEKIRNSERLSVEDGIKLFEHPDLLAVGYLANIVRQRVNNDNTYFIYNQH